MKKSILISSLAISVGLSNAEYIIKYPLEKDHIIIVNTWQLDLPLYSDWIENPISNCTEWNPLPESITINTNFNQHRNCIFNDSRTVQQREKMGNSYRNIGEPTTEHRERQITESRLAVGTAVNWLTTNPSIIMDWNNSGQATCQSWTPDLSNYATNIDVTQTSINCSQPQNRIIQNREQESTTLEYRNVGSQITENRILENQTQTRVMKGTKVNKVCLYDESFNPNYYTWYDGYFWITGYQDIPSLWIEISTGKHVNIMSTPYNVPELTKVSNTEFKYSAPSGVWTITRGSLVPSIYGNNYYQVCFQK